LAILKFISLPHNGLASDTEERHLGQRKIRLLGTPAILDWDGQVQPVRGHQAWALLARIVLARRPLSRQTLAEDLFPETLDPLAALRWCLAALRKALDSSTSLIGDPVELKLPAGTEVDVWQLEKAALQPDEMANLLEGMDPQSSIAFSTWLLAERARLAALVDEQLRNDIINLLATGGFARATQIAERLVRRDIFDERAHVLLVKSLAMAGHVDAAVRHVNAIEKQFMQDLGVLPTAALRSAARRSVASAPGGISAEAQVKSLIGSGLAALAAGAADAGVDNLRRAVSEAENTSNSHMYATATLELGTALIHAIRGFDEEGAILLRQCTEVATSKGYNGVASAAYRELGYVEALAGRRPAAADYLAKAIALADGPDQLAGGHAVTAFNLVDWGKIELGLEHHTQSLELARSVGNQRRQAWTLGMGAWGLLAANNLDAAAKWLEDSLKLADEQRWAAFRPWPVALLCETRIRRDGASADVFNVLEDAFAASCQLRDPCWEAAVAKSMALSFAAEGGMERCIYWLNEARQRCGRETDHYVALQVAILELQVEAKQSLGQKEDAMALARELVSLAAATHMDAHVSRAAKFFSSST
jgi:DNA-binding SARP family transcriptional activator